MALPGYSKTKTTRLSQPADLALIDTTKFRRRIYVGALELRAQPCNPSHRRSRDDDLVIEVGRWEPRKRLLCEQPRFSWCFDPTIPWLWTRPSPLGTILDEAGESRPGIGRYVFVWAPLDCHPLSPVDPQPEWHGT